MVRKLLLTALVGLLPIASAHAQVARAVRVSFTIPAVARITPDNGTATFQVGPGTGWTHAESTLSILHEGNTDQILDLVGMTVVQLPNGADPTSFILEVRVDDGGWIPVKGTGQMWSSAPGIRTGTLQIQHRIRALSERLEPGTWQLAIEYAIRAAGGD